MKLFLTLLIISTLGGAYYGFTKPLPKIPHTRAVSVVYAQSPSPTPTPTLTIEEKKTKLRSYLESKKSPLKDYAGLIVETEVTYDLPYGLIVGISNAESTLCAHLEGGNPYNCWGLGFYGDSKTGFRFKDFQHGILYLAQTLAYHPAYEEFRQTKQLTALSKHYLTGDKQRWVSNVNQVIKSL